MDTTASQGLFDPLGGATTGSETGSLLPAMGGASRQGECAGISRGGEEGAALDGVIRLTVRGMPAPQGSKSFKGMTNAGRAILTESSKKVRPWRQDVKAAAEALIAVHGIVPLDGPIIARMVFTLPKPKSASKTRRTYPMRTPDLSKLLRSTEDALTDAGLWADDARVVEYERLAKVFPGEDPESLPVPGARIEVRVRTAR